MKLYHLLIILVILLIIGLILIDKSDDESKKEFVQKIGITPSENGSVEVYFCPEEDCNSIMLEEIKKADSVICAFYDLNDYRISDVLKEKNASVLFHYENYPGYGFRRETEGLMHDKFCILDSDKVITGSHNPTQGQNKDNVIIFESKILADNYKKEFENLKIYSPSEKKKTKNKRIIYNGYELENYFCPQDNCQDEILSELNSAKTSIYFLTYTFTDKEIAELLVFKNNSGISVSGVIEGYQGKTYWVYPLLEESSIDVILENENTLQHNKVFIIDNKTVITGSFNPTKAADTKNDENIIIIREPDIVNEYISNFRYLYDIYS